MDVHLGYDRWFIGGKGSLVNPKLIGSNDAKHIEALTVENVFGN